MPAREPRQPRPSCAKFSAPVVLRRRLLLLTSIALSACGKSATGPTPVLTTTVNVVVFYDENGNGIRDATEGVHIPRASVKIGVATSQTDAAGRASLFTAQGAATILVDQSSLPPGFQTAASIPVTLPATGDVLIPATLPIGSNHPNVYMTYGDSLTSDLGYPEAVVARLQAYFGVAYLNREGTPATRSNYGADNINTTLASLHPAYTLVLYGTNDWNKCKNQVPCFTIDSLSYIVDGAKGSGSQVFLATLPPVNVGFSNEAPPDREDWVHQIDARIRVLAQQKGVVLVDLEKAFLADPNQPSLFNDHIHPSSKGVGIMVDQFFTAITERQTSTTGRSPFRLDFRL
jgi:lysophospholipase L1-like esterase